MIGADEVETIEPIAPPSDKGRLTNQQILLGQKHDPLEIIKIYSEDEWEEFIREWLEGLSDRYGDVRRASGARDKGRDVIGYVESVNSGGPWDNYQCKHYNHGLYPNLTRVTFNNERLDLTLSGKDRASEGKGFRAIAYSAFIIGLLRYCAEQGLPHSGVVALDSPLVTYKRRDVQPGEAIPEDVGRAFYEALALTPPDSQIIILENEDPPEEVRPKIHYTHFSRSPEVGRYGFFPVAKQVLL